MQTIELKTILPNPYRDVGVNPLEDTRINSLQHAVERDEFWSHLQVRKAKANGSYELVYGHHRLEVLKNLGHATWSFEVVDLDDDGMFHRMTDENLHQGGNNPKAVEETILGAKIILDGYIREAKTVEDLKSKLEGGPRTCTGTPLDWNSGVLVRLKETGAGVQLVYVFLDGKVPEYAIELFLSMYETDPVTGTTHAKTGPVAEAERDAVRSFKTAQQGRVFRRVARKHKLTPKQTRGYAKTLAREGKTGVTVKDMEEKVVTKKSGEAAWRKEMIKQDKARAKKKADWEAQWKKKEVGTLWEYADETAYTCSKMKTDIEQLTPFLDQLYDHSPNQQADLLRSWQEIHRLLSAALTGLPQDKMKTVN